MPDIILKHGTVVQVDEEDYEKVHLFKWRESSNGRYAIRDVSINGKFTSRLMHRFILDVEGTSVEIDHKDGNGFNNSRSNLRIVTRQQNQFNTGKRKSNTSGFKGVFLDEHTGKFRARLRIDGKLITVATCISAKEAAEEYNKAVVRYHGEFAKLNIIE